MNNIEKFVNALIGINKDDKLTIDKEEFFYNNEIKSIANYYRFDNNYKDNLYFFANHILKIKNQKLNNLSESFNRINDCDLIFDNVRNARKPKIEYICNLFIRYLLGNVSYKKFNRYLLILQNLNVNRL